MNKKEVRQQRKALTISVLLYIFALLLITVIISYVAIRIELSLDLIPTMIEGHA